MNRRLVVGAGVLAAILAGAWWLVRGQPESAVSRAQPSESPPQPASRGSRPALDSVRTEWGLPSNVATDDLPSHDRVLKPESPAVLLEIRDFLGGPVAGAEIHVGDRVLTRSDADGFARVASALDSKLRVGAQGYASREIDAPAFGHHVVHLMPESEIVGIVINKGTQATMAGALVTAGEREARTDSQGRFQLGGLEPGGYTVTAAAEGSVGVSPRLQVGLHSQAETVIELEPAYTVRGRVEAKGALPEGLEVVADRGASLRSEIMGRGSVAADGRFEVAGLRAGALYLKLRAPKAPLFVVDEPTKIEVQGDVEGVLLRLPVLHGLNVVVRDDTGQPAEAAKVSGTITTDRGLSSIGCTTTADGRCTLDGLAAGTVEGLRANDGPQKEAFEVPRVDDESLEFVVPRRGSIYGTVVDSSGTPMRDWAVKTVGGDAFGVLVYSDEEGRFLLEGLDAGQVKVEAYALRRTAGRMQFVVSEPKALGSTTVEVAAGQVTHATINVEAPDQATVTGTVVDQTGAPVSGVLVTCVYDNPRMQYSAFPGNGLDMAVSADDGRFELSFSPNGMPLHVFAQSSTGGYAVKRGVAAGARVELQVQAPTEIVFDVQGIEGASNVVLLEGQQEVLRRYAFTQTVRFLGIKPGAYRVEVRTRDDAVAFRRDITLKPGQKLNLP